MMVLNKAEKLKLIVDEEREYESVFLLLEYIESVMDFAYHIFVYKVAIVRILLFKLFCS